MSFTDSIADWLKYNIDSDAAIKEVDGLRAIDLPHTGLHIMPMTAGIWTEHSFDDQYLARFLDARENERWIIQWEDVWKSRRPIAESRFFAFASKSQRIHGRTCRFHTLSAEAYRDFMDENHLLGYTGAKYTYGLSRGAELYAAASFGRPVTLQRNGARLESYELIRFCHRKGYHVSGGLSKLLAGFRKEVSPDDIFTSVDREWSDGSGYRALGFKVLEVTAPICFFLDRSGQRSRTDNGGTRICNAGNIRMAQTLKK